MTTIASICIAFGTILGISLAPAQQRPHNVILFIPDGLRALSVTPQSAPTMADLRDRGVNFKNPHALFPTFTMPNSAGMATGHYPGDTGTFSNTIFAGFAVPHAGGSVTPFIENDAILGDIDEHFGGNYIHEETILKAARAQGFSTAAIGKLGPTFLFDHTERTGEQTIIIDDATGSASGIPLSRPVEEALKAAGLPTAAPGRGENGLAGSFNTPGTTVANVSQQAYFAEATARVVLPMLKARGKPFVLVFWSRDPDGTHHNQGDSLNVLVPGINGPTSAAAIRNADDNLKRLRQALEELGLASTTNILIAADHGFSTISKQSETSPAAKAEYKDVRRGFLPSGFLAIDLAKTLGLPLFDPDSNSTRVPDGTYPKRGNGLVGQDRLRPEIIVAANGGSDLIYLPGGDQSKARRAVEALLHQDYVSGLFVDDEFGSIPGTLPLSSVGLKGSALTPLPAIVVNFRSFATGCDEPLLCAVEIADTPLQQGQGMHGNFSRADTMNFMAAFGPSFKSGFVDEAPTSNADVGRTIAHLLGLKIEDKGNLLGRIIEEAFPNGRMPQVSARAVRSEPSKQGLTTVVRVQRVELTDYFEVAGFPGRTIGLDAREASNR
jgi:arylsulfatase A-like enzyme